MALIVCPECGKSFSDRAPACPECGFPTAEITGIATNANAGQRNIADMAFDDSRYDEAYQLFSQLYAHNQSDPHVLVRLGLAAAAKDYFGNGIPKSTMDILSWAFNTTKQTAPSRDELVARMTQYITDINQVIADTDAVIIKGLTAALNSTAPTRSAGAMVADALFSPVASANRNLYEDNRTLRNNAQIIENAVANKQVIRRYLDTFGSSALKLAADAIGEPLPDNEPLYIALGKLVSNADDAAVYKRLSASASSQANVYGLCYGGERVLLTFENNTSFLMVNDKAVNGGGFAPPSGQVIITNYKIIYNANKQKSSFIKPLDDLIRIEIGGPGNWKTHITFIFPNNTKVMVSPNPAGSQAVFVAALKEELKLPNR